jgi:hypothetical protein
MAGGALIPWWKTTIGVNSVPESDLLMTLSVLRPREALKSTAPLHLTMGSPDWADDADEV